MAAGSMPAPGAAAPTAPAPPDPASAPPPPDDWVWTPQGWVPNPERWVATPQGWVPVSSVGWSAPTTAWQPPPSAGGARPDRTERPSSLDLQNLLLALGTGLVGVAVVVFTAVNWRHLGSGGQGAVLGGMTVFAVAGAVVARRRDMPATAEALASVAVLLALADVHAVRVVQDPRPDAHLWWAGGLLVVGALAASFGRLSRITAPKLAAAIALQLPLPVLVIWGAWPWEQAEVVLLVQTAAVMAIARRGRWRAPAWIVARAVAAITWGLTVLAIAGRALEEGGNGRMAAALLLLLAAGVAALDGAIWRDHPAEQAMAMWATSALTVAAMLTMAGAWLDPFPAVAVASGASLLAATAARRLPAQWGSAPVAVGTGAAAIGGAALLVPAMASLADAWAVAARPWAGTTWTAPAVSGGREVVVVAGDGSRWSTSMPWWAVALDAAVLVGLGVRWWPRWSIAARASAVVAMFVGLMVVAPASAPVSIGGAMTMGLVGALAAAAGATLVRSDPIWRRAAAAATASALAWAALWALASPGLSLVGAGTAVVAAGLVLAAGTAGDDRRLAIPAAAMLALAVPVTAGVAAVVLGAPEGVPWTASVVAGAALSLVAALVLDPSGRGQGVRSDACRWLLGASVAVHLLALAGLLERGTNDQLSVALGAGGLALVLHALRPGRSAAAALGAAELVLVLWLQLQEAGVATVEAYTMPLAALLLVVGVVARLRAGSSLEEPAEEPISSWLWLGPALVVGFVPSVVLSFADPGAVRPTAALVAGAAVLVLGAILRWRAAVDVGVPVVVVVGLRQLVPVAGDLPTWVIIGVTGLVLVAVGATFEQRRKDLRSLRRRYQTLR